MSLAKPVVVFGDVGLSDSGISGLSSVFVEAAIIAMVDILSTLQSGDIYSFFILL